MNDFQMIPVGGALSYTADFTDALPASVTLSACTWSISPSINLSNQVDSLGSALSTIRVSGALHGITYTLQAIGTLSNGETVPKDVTLLGFNA